MKRGRHGSGFMLMEMLLIGAIGCILLLILLPVYSMAKAKSKCTTCLSNLRQIGMALQLYAQDNDERFPPYRNRRNDGKGKSTIWDSPEGIYAGVYLKTKCAAVMYCPMDSYMGSDVQIFGVNHKLSSYYFNMQPPDSTEGTLWISGLMRNGSVIVPSSSYPMVRDANLGYKERINGMRATGCRHMRSVNILYVDLHAESKRAENGRVID